MIFKPTPLPGVFRIEQERRVDDRGFFARIYCRNEFEAQGIPFVPVQCSTSFNSARGTLRGLHYQAPPHAEAKIVRCTRGAIFDAVVDLRPESPTFRRAYTVVLSADEGTMLYIPEGCAHGFLTLVDGCEIEYMMSEFYHPESARGVRWNDPAFGISWPEPVRVISERDRTYPDFTG